METAKAIMLILLIIQAIFIFILAIDNNSCVEEHNKLADKYNYDCVMIDRNNEFYFNDTKNYRNPFT